jgi:hypothetical protein
MKKNLPDRGKLLSAAKILFCSLAVTTLQAQELRKQHSISKLL